MANNNKTTNVVAKVGTKNWGVLLGAAFIMATSAIGPGFLTQTAQFTSDLMASFAFVF